MTALNLKVAPAMITTYSQALAAWNTYHKYKNLSASARAMADSYQGGTASEQRHRHRYEQYADAADAWATPIYNWLRDMAQIETDDAKR